MGVRRNIDSGEKDSLGRPIKWSEGHFANGVNSGARAAQVTGRPVSQWSKHDTEKWIRESGEAVSEVTDEGILRAVAALGDDDYNLSLALNKATPTDVADALLDEGGVVRQAALMNGNLSEECVDDILDNGDMESVLRVCVNDAAPVEAAGDSLMEFYGEPTTVCPTTWEHLGSVGHGREYDAVGDLLANMQDDRVDVNNGIAAGIIGDAEKHGGYSQVAGSMHMLLQRWSQNENIPEETEKTILSTPGNRTMREMPTVDWTRTCDAVVGNTTHEGTLRYAADHGLAGAAVLKNPSCTDEIAAVSMFGPKGLEAQEDAGIWSSGGYRAAANGVANPDRGAEFLTTVFNTRVADGSVRPEVRDLYLDAVQSNPNCPGVLKKWRVGDPVPEML